MRQFSRDLYRACRMGCCEEKDEIVNGCFKSHISIVLLKDVAKVFAGCENCFYSALSKNALLV